MQPHELLCWPGRCAEGDACPAAGLVSGWFFFNDGNATHPIYAAGHDLIGSAVKNDDGTITLQVLPSSTTWIVMYCLPAEQL